MSNVSYRVLVVNLIEYPNVCIKAYSDLDIWPDHFKINMGHVLVMYNLKH